MLRNVLWWPATQLACDELCPKEGLRGRPRKRLAVASRMILEHRRIGRVGLYFFILFAFSGTVSEERVPWGR